jgi:MYXO-CTERM domain-containing protein
VSEAGSPTVQLKAVLSATSAGTVTVPFTITGTATKGTDYSTPISAGQITISSGTTATYLINITDDMVADPDETVIITMGTTTGASASGTTVYTLTIGDDDSGGAGGGAGGGGRSAAGGGGADTTRGVCGCSAGTAGWMGALMLVALTLRRRRS